nr:MAG TPA: hypothetical protein [Caudoviricetes sp.]
MCYILIRDIFLIRKLFLQPIGELNIVPRRYF